MTTEEMDFLCERFFPVFQEYCRTHGTSVTTLTEVSDIASVDTLIGINETDGVKSIVLVPVSLLQSGITEQALSGISLLRSVDDSQK